MEISYRRATVEDVPTLVKLRAAFLAEFFKADVSDSAILAAIREYFGRTVTSEQFIGYVAVARGAIIAVGGLVYDWHLPSIKRLDGRQAYILNMYTDTAWRRRGIATAILGKLMDHAKADGLGRISLHSAPQARAMYAKAGFTAVDSEMRIEFGEKGKKAD